MVVYGELEIIEKCTKKVGGGGSGRGGGVRVVVYEELEVIEKCTKKRWGRGSGRGRGEVGQQGGVERRIEVVMEMPKKSGGGGVRVDVNEELELL